MTATAGAPGLAYDTETRALRDSLTRMLTDAMPSAELRAQSASADGYDRALWDRLCEFGITAVEIPTAFGGLGLGPRESAIVHEVLGRHLYPGPARDTQLAATALVSSDRAASQERWLPEFASGAARGCVALLTDDGNPPAPTVKAHGSGDAWQVTGTLDWVINAGAADLLVLEANTPEAGAGASVFAVETGARGVTVEPLATLDLTRRAARVRLVDTPAQLVADAALATRVRAAVERTALLTAAAEAAGGIDWCLDTSVRHAKEREQFEQPIGAFQSVAHACVDLLAERDRVAAGVRYAATALALDNADADLALRVVALRAGQAYRAATEATVHLLGGLGFTWEHDAHYYYRRACLAEQVSMPPRALRARIADLTGL